MTTMQRCLDKRAHLDDENHSVLVSDVSYVEERLYLGDMLVKADYVANDAELSMNYGLLETDAMDLMSLRLFARCVNPKCSNYFSSAVAVPTNATAATSALPQWGRRGKRIGHVT